MTLGCPQHECLTAVTVENSEDGKSVEALTGKNSEDGDRVEEVSVRGRKRPGCEGDLSLGDSQNSGSQDSEENWCDQVRIASMGRENHRKVNTEQCGLLKKLLPGDEVFADHGFTVQESVGLNCAKLEIPPFTRASRSFHQLKLTRPGSSLG